MLEFIVLGQIPGTNLCLTFIDFMGLFSSTIVAIIAVGIIQAFRHRAMLQRVQIQIQNQTI